MRLGVGAAIVFLATMVIGCGDGPMNGGVNFALAEAHASPALPEPQFYFFEFPERLANDELLTMQVGGKTYHCAHLPAQIEESGTHSNGKPMLRCEKAARSSDLEYLDASATP